MMKLYSAPNPAPNPRRVLIFLAEKGISMPIIDLSLLKGEHKAPDFVAKNSRAQIPVLELDDGTTISESVSICRYLDDLHPNPPMFGTNAIERATIDMWVRRIEFNVMAPVGLFWAHAHPFTARVVKQHKEFGESNRARWEASVQWLDTELAKTAFIAGDSFTIADIAALTTIDFALWIGLEIPDGCDSLKAWHQKVSSRASVVSLQPA
jgi:glutathione S-transferase